MPNTGERREIKRYSNAKEVETVNEAKKLLSKTKQRTAKLSNEEQVREHRHDVVSRVAKVDEPKRPQTEEQGAEKMVDEGDPNTLTKK